MFTKLTTTLMAGALALTSLTAPTELRAGNDTGKIIGGLAIGAVLGAVIANEIEDRKDSRNHGARRHTDAYSANHRRSYGTRDHRGGRNLYRGRGRHDGYGQRRVKLPGACRVQSGHRSGYSGRCLRGYEYGRRAMPSACAVRVGGRHGTIYRDRCLNRYGYH